MKKFISIILMGLIVINSIPLAWASDYINLINSTSLQKLESEKVADTAISGGATEPNFKFSDTLGTNGVPSTKAIYPSHYESMHTNTKNQKKTNLCWDFATISNFESALYEQKSKKYDLSEEHAVQCIKGTDTPEYRIQQIQNTQGNFEDIWIYLTRSKYNGAIEETSSLPFNTSTYKTLDELNVFSRVPYYPTQYIAVSDSLKGTAKINKVKEVIYNNGSITAQIDENPNYFSGALGAYYYNPSGILKYPHLVDIVGWDDSIAATAFNNSAVTQNGAFIAKDSYYGKIIYLSYCSVDYYNWMRGITEVRERSFFDYQYEHYKLPPDIKSNDKNKELILNKFNKQYSGYEELKSVSVLLEDTATRFNVYVSPTGKFEDLAKVELSNCSTVGDMYTMYNSGEFVVDLKEPLLLRSNGFLVGVELYNPNKDVSFKVEKNYPYEGGSVNPVIESGSSYRLNDTNLDYCSKSNYTDTSSLGYDICIKAFTKRSNDIATVDVDKTTNLINVHNVFEFGDVPTSKIIHKYNEQIILNTDYKHPGINQKENNSVSYNYGTTNGYFNITKKMESNFIGSIEMRLDSSAEIYVTAKVSKGTTIVLKDESGNDVDTATYDRSGILTKRLDFNKNGGRVYIGLKEDGNLGLVKIQINPLRKANNNNINNTIDFSSSVFKDYVDKNGYPILLNNFIVNPCTFDTAYIKSDYPSLYGYHYESCLCLESTAKNVYFYSPANTDIYITMKTEGDYLKNLTINNFWGEEFAYFNVNSNLKTYKFHYDGLGDNLYININSPRIKIFAITIKTHNEINSGIYKEWNFDSPEYYGIDTITKTLNINDMDIYATVDKDVQFKHSNVTIDNIKRRRYVSLKGEGTESYRCLGFDVPQNCTIRILARSGSKTAPREMLVTDGQNMLLGDIEVNSNIAAYYDVPYIGNGDRIYIKSKSGTLDIYGVELINSSITVERYFESIAEAAENCNNNLDDNIISGNSVDLSQDMNNYTTENNVNITNKYNENGGLNIENIINHINETSLSTLSEESTEKFMYKSQLTSDDERYFYDKLYEVFYIKKSTEDVTYINMPVNMEYSTANIEKLRKTMRNAMTAFINDYPEVFWVKINFNSIFKRVEYNNTQYLASYGMIAERNNYVGSVEDLKNNIVQADMAVNEIVNSISNETIRFNSDYLKIEYVYNYIKSNCVYTNGMGKYNGYSVLINKMGNCSGIARAFKMVCDGMNIENIIVRCKVNNSSIAHLCNLVKLDGCWYICDLTSDLNNTNNEYFMIKLPENYTLLNPTSFTDETMTFLYPTIKNINYFLAGDANMDGILTEDDADVAMAIAVSGSTNTHQLLNSDVDFNGVVNSTDVAIILEAMSNNTNITTVVDNDTVEYINNISEEVKNQLN